MQSGLQLWGCCTALLAAQLATAPAPHRDVVRRSGVSIIVECGTTGAFMFWSM